MAGVFISYRRDDSLGFAGRLADDLEETFGHARVFRDIEIPVGSDFGDVLHRAIAACDVLLVVIGRHWAGQPASGEKSRLFEPHDWVRAEIESALALGKQIVPVLVGGAVMPAKGKLPDSIVRLTRLQAVSLSDRYWDVGVEELSLSLRNLSPSLQDDAPVPAGMTPADILLEIGQGLLDEVLDDRRYVKESVPFFHRVLRAFGRRLKGFLMFVFVVSLLYVGVRLFGNVEMLRDLDAVESRLLVGWERFQTYIQTMI